MQKMFYYNIKCKVMSQGPIPDIAKLLLGQIFHYVLLIIIILIIIIIIMLIINNKTKFYQAAVVIKINNFLISF